MERLIDPKTLARVKNLPLVAKTVAEGFLYGHQTSIQRGVGIEFSQYRSYETGDDLSSIDWKLFARSDRYFVREAERESEIDIWFLIDTSNSMRQRTSYQFGKKAKSHESQTELNKLHYAKMLVASLSYLAQKQGDSFGLIAMKENNIDVLPSANGLKHWQRLLLKLERIQAGNSFPNAEQLKLHLAKINRPSLLFVISDFAQVKNEIVDALSLINTTKNETVAFQLKCDDEEYYPFKGTVRFKDLETNEEVLVNSSQASQNYQQARSEYQQALENQLNKNNIYSQQFNIDKPLDAALFSYLKSRNRVST